MTRGEWKSLNFIVIEELQHLERPPGGKFDKLVQYLVRKDVQGGHSREEKEGESCRNRGTFRFRGGERKIVPVSARMSRKALW